MTEVGARGQEPVDKSKGVAVGFRQTTKVRVDMDRKLAVAVLALGVSFLIPAAPGEADGPFQFYSLSPCRLVDTRLAGTTVGTYGPVLTSGVERKFPVQGSCGVPVGARAVTVNITAVAPTNQGRLTAYPSGITAPNTSNINFPPGTTALGNGAIVPLANQAVEANDFAVMPFVVPGTGQVHLVLDVTGYFM